MKSPRYLPLSFLVAVVGFAWTIAAAELPEAATSQNPATRYTKPERPSRDGIDKAYFGRQIAHVMGHQAAEWLERPERAEEEKTELLVTLLKLKPGEAVADIGAGTGYFSRRLARQVGTNGTIYAVEIQQEMLDILTNKMAEIGIHNVKPILGTITDPKLPANSLDLILIVDVYHEFDHPYEMAAAMSRALKPGGRMVFVEYRAEDPTVPIKLLHKMSETQVKKEMQPHPLVWSETLRDLPRQHVIIFTRKP